jgi:hypothetical protein
MGGEAVGTATRKQKLTWGVILTAIGMISGWITSGCQSYAQIEHRVSVIETKQDEYEKAYLQLRSDITEIRTDIKQLLARPH